MKKIRVLVVEDSRVEQDLIVRVLSSDPAIEVAGVAADGEEALEKTLSLDPDVITMDVHMPKMGGLEATRKIMESHPKPIVVVSSSAAFSREGEKAFLALEVGALALARKPPGIAHPDFVKMSHELVDTVKLMSEVKVVRRWESLKRQAPGEESARAAPAPEIVAIGASAGGPLAIQRILAALPADFPLPILIVQHIAQGFTRGFADWLTLSTGYPVRVAVQGEKMSSGVAYVAPDGRQMGVGDNGRIELADDPPEGGLKPSVSYLFRSVQKKFGAHAIGVLLTGMGRDGAAELKAMKERGCLTIAQDEESSMIFGMPGEAVSMNGASYVLHLDSIPAMLCNLSSRKMT